MNRKKLVFITGSTGNMGSETIKEFLKKTDRFKLRLLVLDNKSEKLKVLKYRFNRNIEIIYGDMKSKSVIDKCIKGVDFVLHIGAVVSPAADINPKHCFEVNYGSTKHIINAIKEQKNSDNIGFAFIGSVGQTGDRLAPIHWGRVGDPIKPSIFDYYSVSKIASERLVIESGLKKWVVLRQTGILPFNSKAKDDPIVFHQNLNNPIEWITSKESGRLMANICDETINENFWCNVYNVGGGEKWRFTYYEFLEKYLTPLDINIKNIYDPKDFALYNFHGQWYLDSDILNDFTNFRFVDSDDFFYEHSKLISKVKKIPLVKKLIPNEIKMKLSMDKASSKERGPEWMLNYNNDNWIKAFYGSKNEKNKIKSWDEGYEIKKLSTIKNYLDHGYDETKPVSELDLSDIKKAAKFRGGTCLSSNMISGDLFTKLKWKCHNNHNFEASPFLILKAGHWCPICEKESWNYYDLKTHSPFFNQVIEPLNYNINISIKKLYNIDNIDYYK